MFVAVTKIFSYYWRIKDMSQMNLKSLRLPDFLLKVLYLKNLGQIFFYFFFFTHIEQRSTQLHSTWYWWILGWKYRIMTISQPLICSTDLRTLLLPSVSAETHFHLCQNLMESEKQQWLKPNQSFQANLYDGCLKERQKITGTTSKLVTLISV